MTFFGLKIAASFSRRSSGTLTTPTWSSIPPKPPVSAWPRVSVLKTVVLPDPARPTMAICIGRLSPTPAARSRGGRSWSRLVAGGGIHDVEQWLAGGVSAEVVGEELDAPVEHAAARPRGV